MLVSIVSSPSPSKNHASFAVRKLKGGSGKRQHKLKTAANTALPLRSHNQAASERKLPYPDGKPATSD